MAEKCRFAALAGGLCLVLGGLSPAWGDEQPTPEEIAGWVTDLGDDQYLRRESATRKLAAAGPLAVEPLASALRSGDLEVVQRALDVMTEIALRELPQHDGGAWDELSSLASQGTGAAAARAESVLAEIRLQRTEQSRTALKAAGVFVGTDEFIVGSIAQHQLVVGFGDQWNRDTDTLHWLRWLSGVEFARIEGSAISPEVLRSVVQIPDLKTIALIDGTVTQETLEPLKDMPRIHSLIVRYVPLKDEYASLLTALPLRISLDLMGTGISAETVESMRNQLPGLEITHRQGGFLGVQCPNTNDICEVTEVVAGSAAEQAGLIAGDVIVGIAGHQVRAFADLQEQISHHMPGDQVEVKFLRGGDVQTVQLELGRLEPRE